MKGSHHVYFAFFEKFPVLFCHSEFRRNEPLRRNTSEADDNLRLDELNLAAKIPKADLGFLGFWVAVVRRTTLDHVRDIHVFVPVKVKKRKIKVKKFSAFSDEGKPLEVLLLARTFADEHNLSVFVPRSENEVCSRFSERTFIAVKAFVFKQSKFVVQSAAAPFGEYKSIKKPSRKPDCSAIAIDEITVSDVIITQFSKKVTFFKKIVEFRSLLL